MKIKLKAKTKIIIISSFITCIVTALVIGGVLYGYELLPTGKVFDFNTLGTYFAATGSVGALFIILFTTNKQLKNQNKIQEQNVKVQLFDKRYSVFYSVYNMILTISGGNKPNSKEITDFGYMCCSVELLFDSNVQYYVKSVYINAFELFCFDDPNKDNIPGREDRKNYLVSEEKDEIVKWFKEQLNGNYIEIFKNYLDIEHITLITE